ERLVGLDAEATKYPLSALAAGLQPDVVETQDVDVVAAPRLVAHLVQHVDEVLKLRRELGKDGREYLPAHAAANVLRQRAVGRAAHPHVVIDVHLPPREALSEEAGDKQRDVADPLQSEVALLRRARVHRLGKNQRERLQSAALLRAFVQ